MPRKLLYFLLFSNICVLALYSLRWWSNYHYEIEDLSAMDATTVSLLWDAMPKAVLFFLIAFMYLLAELIITIRTPLHADILDIPNPSSTSDR